MRAGETPDGNFRIQYVGQEIKTLDDLIEACEADLDKWQISRWDTSTWQTPMKLKGGKEKADIAFHITNHRVDATFERVMPEGLSLDEHLEKFKADAADHAPAFHDKFDQPSNDAEHMLELDIFDPHWNMYSWAAETGEDQDSEIIDNLARWAVERLTHQAKPYNIAEICVPLGNDLFHAVDDEAETPRSGNKLDVDTRQQRTFEEVHEWVTDVGEYLMQIAPVTFHIVPGNHDYKILFPLGRDLKSWFRNTDRVTVNNSPRWRKHHVFGNNLIGFTHGDQEAKSKLPRIMAEEWPQAWAETDGGTRTWHTGHGHHREQTSYITTEDLGGVRVQMIPSLAAKDAYHYQKGYNRIRAAEAFIWHRELGEINHMAAPVPGLKVQKKDEEKDDPIAEFDWD